MRHYILDVIVAIVAALVTTCIAVGLTAATAMPGDWLWPLHQALYGHHGVQPTPPVPW